MGWRIRNRKSETDNRLNSPLFKEISNVPITESNGFISRHVLRVLREIRPEIELTLVASNDNKVQKN